MLFASRSASVDLPEFELPTTMIRFPIEQCIGRSISEGRAAATINLGTQSIAQVADTAKFSSVYRLLIDPATTRILAAQVEGDRTPNPISRKRTCPKSVVPSIAARLLR